MTRRERKPLTPEKQALASAYIPFARTLAKPFKLTWYFERDEFESAALLGLIQAAEAFDERRGIKFATFARPRILGALLSTKRFLLRRRERDCTTTSYLEDYQLLGKRVLEHPKEHVVDSRDLLGYWFTCLSKIQALICQHIYVDGGSQQSASTMLGVAKSHVSVQHGKALAELVKHPDLMQLAIEMNSLDSNEGRHDACAQA